MNKTLPLVARFADEWNGVHLTPAAYRERITRLNELLDAMGRPRSAIRRSHMTQGLIGATDAEVRAKLGGKPEPADSSRVVGTPAQIIDRIGQYADAGMERIMLMWRDQDDIAGLELLASAVLPHFHKS